jgi:hypothetical protein
MDTVLKISFLTATALTGILCGASLDQSFKQLPARHKIGVINYSAYAKAADLKNGVVWYAIIGIGAALTTITTAILVLESNQAQNFSHLVYLSAFMAVSHSICTTQAAPTLFKTKAVSDEKLLRSLLNKFERIQTIRSIFIALNFISLLWALSILV